MQLPAVLDPVIRIWRHRNYAWYMGGMGPYLISTWMLRVATGWLAWELTESYAWLGYVAAADLAPMLVLSMFAGAIIDRSDPLKQQIFYQWLQVGHAIALAVITLAGWMTIEILFVLCLFLGCVHPFAAAARHSVVPASVPKEEIPTALAIDSSLFNASRFIGPAIAAPIILGFGAGGVFFTHTLGCIFFLVGLYQVQMSFGERHRHGGANMLADIREGFAYVANHAGMAPLFLLLACSASLIRPLADMLPGFAGKVFEAGPAGLAWLTASMGIGATISAVMVAIYGRLSGLTLMALASYLVHVIATLVFVSTNYIAVAFVAGIFWGYTLTSMSTAVQAMVQSNVDNRLRGRVMAVYTLIYRGTPAIGAVIIGLLAEDLGLQLATGLCAAVCIIPWLLALKRREVITTSLEGGVADWQSKLVERTKDNARQHTAVVLRLVDGVRKGLTGLPQRTRQVSSGTLSRQLRRMARRGGLATRRIVQRSGSFASGRVRATLSAIERTRASRQLRKREGSPPAE